MTEQQRETLDQLVARNRRDADDRVKRCVGALRPEDLDRAAALLRVGLPHDTS